MNKDLNTIYEVTKAILDKMGGNVQIPEPPETGTYVLKSVNGTVQWVEV